MAKKPIEERIREKYAEGGGDWVVEKGKVAECKLLKEAVEKIDELLFRLAKIDGYYRQANAEKRELACKIEDIKIEALAQQVNSTRLTRRAVAAMKACLDAIEEQEDTPVA